MLFRSPPRRCTSHGSWPTTSPAPIPFFTEARVRWPNGLCRLRPRPGLLEPRSLSHAIAIAFRAARASFALACHRHRSQSVSCESVRAYRSVPAPLSLLSGLRWVLLLPVSGLRPSLVSPVLGPDLVLGVGPGSLSWCGLAVLLGLGHPLPLPCLGFSDRGIMRMVGTPHILPRGYGVLVIRSAIYGWLPPAVAVGLPWKSRLGPLCPAMQCAPVANTQKWGSGTRPALTHMYSILPPATCHAVIHLARTVARTALPCAACTGRGGGLAHATCTCAQWITQAGGAMRAANGIYVLRWCVSKNVVDERQQRRGGCWQRQQPEPEQPGCPHVPSLEKRTDCNA
jgi:hypothetical protein